uniref:phosphoinositide 5-phosphatase n=1 Tax=Acrobeloides nanus TaxID=290746 RepID=A0A914CY29_9BILA
MCGSVLIRTIYVGHRTARVAIISRLSCERVGTRFNVRGVNDDGHVANFVESEQLILYEEQESSFVQIRGSVPLFWEQPGIQVGSHKVKLRTVEISMPAFERHFQLLKKIYGNISTVNLLGSKEGEKLLSTAFQTALKGSSHVDVPLIPYDYHAQMKISKESINELLRKLEPLIKENQFFHKTNDCVYRTQMGVIRTNCLDCLDRTNSVQILIGMKALTAQLADLKMDQVKGNIITRFEEVIKDLWIKNGDQCSVIYAGTGALEGKSKFKDASRSLARTIQNNLMDSSKQEAFDLFLFGCNFGNHAYDKAANLVPSTVLKGGYYFYECPGALEALVEKQDEISTKEKLSVFAGTWNVNGGKNMYNVAFRHEQSLDAWIFPTLNIFRQKTYDIIAIGLEEIVDLNASNLMKASTTNQRVWRDGIRKSIIDATNEKYVVAVCEQLVGVCLLVFLKPIILPRVRDLCVDEVKTGMGGATGNKGSIAVRMTVDATSLCFVCSHFAAGQHEVSARNEDFMTAWKKIRFPMVREIEKIRL